MKITCECGHPVHRHRISGCFGEDIAVGGATCECNLSCEAVEARWWARHYWRESSRLRTIQEMNWMSYYYMGKENSRLQAENERLRAKLEEIAEKDYSEIPYTWADIVKDIQRMAKEARNDVN